MRLFEAILNANHQALAGDQSAGLRPAEYAEELPVVALTCIDPRLNRILPQVLGVPEESFIWLRNAGNIVTGPLTSTMRSLALACAIKGGREIAVIGHTDCQVGKTTTMDLLQRLQSLGIERRNLPTNVNEFFGTFGSERANVIKAVEFIRQSPLISRKTPVHGLLVDTETGRLDWLVNGYEPFAAPAEDAGPSGLEQLLNAFKPLGDLSIGEMKFPESKIGDIGVNSPPIIPAAPSTPPSSPAKAPQPPEPPPLAPAKLPLPPVNRSKIQLRRRNK